MALPDSFPYVVVAYTPVHVGSTRLVHGVDLPFARDEFGLPYVPGSSVKGALRAFVRRTRMLEAQHEKLVFGSEPERAPTEAGALAFMDARLALIPARRLRGVWGWVTSASLLKNSFILEGGDFSDFRVNPGGFLACCDGNGEVGKVEVVNEEFVFSLSGRIEAQCLVDLVEEARGILKVEGLEKPVLVVDDDVIVDVVERSMLVVDRVGLNYSKKVVERGPWSEEYVPQFTVFRGYLVKTPRASTSKAGQAVEKFIDSLRNGVSFVLGGKETVGKGLVSLKVTDSSGEA